MSMMMLMMRTVIMIITTPMMSGKKIESLTYLTIYLYTVDRVKLIDS